MPTFEDCWRRVQLHAPDVPVFLARAFVQQAFARLSEDRPWVWQRKELNLQTLAPRTLTVGVTNASTTVTSAAAFVASDVGRQLTIAGLPSYTLATFTDASTMLLGAAYAGSTDAAAAAQITSRYLICPADFGEWLAVADLASQRLVPTWITFDQLNVYDAARTSTGDPGRALIARGYGTIPTVDLGRALYEWWPAPTAARTYPALYRSRPAQLTDTDTLPGVLAQRDDLLVTGALMECAKWPGTSQAKNAYFNLSTYQLLAKEFQAERIKLALRDDDILPQDWGTVNWGERMGWLSYDTHQLRATDATLADYY